jgi:hypothetical protein
MKNIKNKIIFTYKQYLNYNINTNLEYINSKYKYIYIVRINDLNYGDFKDFKQLIKPLNMKLTIFKKKAINKNIFFKKLTIYGHNSIGLLYFNDLNNFNDLMKN